MPPVRSTHRTGGLASLEEERRSADLELGGARLQRGFDLPEVMVAVSKRVVLDEELASERRIRIQRHGGRPVQLLVAERPDGRCGRGAVDPKQLQGRLLVLIERSSSGSRTATVDRQRLFYVTYRKSSTPWEGLVVFSTRNSNLELTYQSWRGDAPANVAPPAGERGGR